MELCLSLLFGTSDPASLSGGSQLTLKVSDIWAFKHQNRLVFLNLLAEVHHHISNHTGNRRPHLGQAVAVEGDSSGALDFSGKCAVGRKLSGDADRIFEIRPGEETRLAIIMMPSNKIVVTILDENGEPLPRGAVLLTSDLGLRSSMVITKGLGEGLVPVDEVVVEVGTTFLQEYVVQRVPISLEAGGTTEVEIRLTRR